MNKYVRAFFLPIMLLAGVFTSGMCALIIAPVVFVHWLRSIGESEDEVQKAEEFRRQNRLEMYGEDETLRLQQEGR